MAYLYLKTDTDAPGSRPSKKYLAFLLFVVGVYLFGSATYPIVQYQFEYSSRFGQILSPLSPKFYNQQGSILGNLSGTDYTQLNNWFVANQEVGYSLPSTLAEKSSQSYSISIPKLKVDNATVIIGSMDLKKSLIQYPQTALPGTPGNGVIFGHSVLPQFFNPKSYMTIFSTLYRLKPGDEIVVDYDSIRYQYLVEDMYEVQPTDLSVLEQRFDGRYLTLVTCTPPGTYLRRLVVKSRITDI